MEVRIELKLSDRGTWYRSVKRANTISLCTDEVYRLFGVKRVKRIDLVVSNVKPRGPDYYEATYGGSPSMAGIYSMTKAESGKWNGWSGWCAELDRTVRKGLGNKGAKVYFWVEV